MNKFQFIKHLLDTKKFTPTQKERFFKLVSTEMANVDDRDQKILEDIQLIKHKIGLKDEKLPIKGKLAALKEETKLKSKVADSVDEEKKNTGFMVDLDGTLVEGEAPDGFNGFNIEDFIDSGTLEDLGYDNSNENINEGFNPLWEGQETHLETKKGEKDVNKDGSINEMHSKSIIKKAKDKVSNEYLKSKKKFHNPKKVNEWLQCFTQNNTAIKFSTHLWDDNLYPTYENYIGALNDDYNKYNFWDLQHYSNDLYWNKIYPFLFQKELTSLQKSGTIKFGWGRYNVKIGWQYPALIKSFCEKKFDNKGNKASTPFAMDLPKELMPEVPSKTIKSFEEVVNLFKQEIEFRDNSLWVGVMTELRQNLLHNVIDPEDLKSLKGCSFYTNTEYVLKAISRIFAMIKARAESLRATIACAYCEETHQYIIEILHLNSYSDLIINHPKLMSEEKGDLSILRTTLLSLCDFSIESRFKDSSGKIMFARVEYLYDEVELNEWKPNIIPLVEDPGGFKFILKFLV